MTMQDFERATKGTAQKYRPPVSYMLGGQRTDIEGCTEFRKGGNLKALAYDNGRIFVYDRYVPIEVK